LREGGARGLAARAGLGPGARTPQGESRVKITNRAIRDLQRFGRAKVFFDIGWDILSLLFNYYYENIKLPNRIQVFLYFAVMPDLIRHPGL
jgi:hypothetical protein